jgi:hypothetical protein
MAVACIGPPTGSVVAFYIISIGELIAGFIVFGAVRINCTVILFAIII